VKSKVICRHNEQHILWYTFIDNERQHYTISPDCITVIYNLLAVAYECFVLKCAFKSTIGKHIEDTKCYSCPMCQKTESGVFELSSGTQRKAKVELRTLCAMISLIYHVSSLHDIFLE
jgi:hypothetical protein